MSCFSLLTSDTAWNCWHMIWHEKYRGQQWKINEVCQFSTKKKYIWSVSYHMSWKKKKMIFIVWILEGDCVQINHDVTFVISIIFLNIILLEKVLW